MLDVSDDVRAEIGDEEANRLLAGENAPGNYDCTSCRSPGDPGQVRTSTVLFVGEETAVLAFAHAACIPSQVVRVSEEQVQGAVRTITADDPSGTSAGLTADAATGAAAPVEEPRPDRGRAVLGVTCGQVLIGDALHAAVVVEPTAPIARPGSDGPGDDFLPLLIEQGFLPVTGITQPPATVPGWSVLVAMGQLHAILQPPAAGTAQPIAWWQAHQSLPVTDGWRTSANQNNQVLVYAAPAGSIGQQPREDLMRDALDKAAAEGVLVAAAMPLAGT
ncbi:MAG: hypothetical protein ACRDP3_15050 [Streptomyces sp.]|uniref:hypothetical protein n=1 Tax=Streptomyces sp. TaxID=1931 RepID=UPI003D6AA179